MYDFKPYLDAQESYPAKAPTYTTDEDGKLQLTYSSAKVTYLPSVGIVTPNNHALIAAIYRAKLAYVNAFLEKQDLEKASLLKAMGPAGNLTLKIAEGDRTPLVFCANSTGIAPFCAMLQYLARAKVYPEINMFWGLKTVQDVYLAEEFGVYEKMWNENGSKFTMKICLSREAAIPEVVRGELSHLALGRIQPSVEKLLPQQYQFYICGGKSFVLDTKTFIATKFPDSTIYSERFN
jgi:ferredoxin-NADP reductase